MRDTTQLEAGAAPKTPPLPEPLTVLQYNLLHNEIRDAVELLYDQLAQQSEEIERLRHTNDRMEQTQIQLKEQHQVHHKRWQEEIQSAQNQIRTLQNDLENERLLKRHSDSQVMELHKEVQAKERAIQQVDHVLERFTSEMALKEQQEESKNDGSGPRLPQMVSRHELQYLAEQMKRKEKDIYDNMSHMQAATSSLQQQTNDLVFQIAKFEEEIASLETETSSQQTKISTNSQGDNHGASQPVRQDTLQIISTLRDQRRSLEQENQQLSAENRALQTELTNCLKQREELQQQVQHLSSTSESRRQLVEKYEQSALDGTETIEELQIQLAKACKEQSILVASHNQTLKQISQQAAVKNRQLMEQNRALEQQNHKTEEEIHTLKLQIAELHNTQLVNPRQPDSGDNQIHVNSQPDSDETASELPKSAPPKTRNDSMLGKTKEKIFRDHVEHCRKPNAEDVLTISLPQDESNSSQRNQPTPSQSANKQHEHTPSTCRHCGDEPFGFMVKCQKCKQLFHAGCAKANSKKRQVGVIFKCTECQPPTRPHKLPRVDQQQKQQQYLSSSFSSDHNRN